MVEYNRYPAMDKDNNFPDDITSSLARSIANYFRDIFSGKPTNGKLPVGKDEIVVNVKDYGAKGDGRTNDTEAIATAIANMPPEGAVLYFPPGNYLHNGVRIEDKTRFEIRGPGTLVASTPWITEYLKLSRCTNFAIVGLGSRHNNPTARRPTAGRAFTVFECTNFSITDCEAFHCEGVGIMAIRSSYGTISGNRVHHTWADGIGVYNASQHITISGNTCTETGDDAIAVVSTPGEDFICHDITITGNTSHHSLSRGMVVAGGDRVTISNNTVIDPRNAGVWVGRDGGNNCSGCTGITVTGNTIKNANTYGYIIDSPGIDVISSDIKHEVKHVVVANNVVLNSRTWGIRVGASTPGTSNVHVSDNIVDNSGLPGIFFQNVFDLHISGNHVSNSTQGGILGTELVRGLLIIVNNSIRNPCGSTGQTIGLNIPQTASVVGRISGNVILDDINYMTQAIQGPKTVSVSDNQVNNKSVGGGADSSYRVNSTLLAGGATETSGTGSGVGVFGLRNASVPPTTNPTSGGVIYVENGALKYRSSNGVITTVAPA